MVYLLSGMELVLLSPFSFGLGSLGVLGLDWLGFCSLREITGIWGVLSFCHWSDVGTSFLETRLFIICKMLQL